MAPLETWLVERLQLRRGTRRSRRLVIQIVEGKVRRPVKRFRKGKEKLKGRGLRQVKVCKVKVEED